ncbi:MAG TPA: hypothetical protein VFF28_01810 [Candidatus Nanoarchaeia archaeon]|nr:hypothetical protein [Candidatus Nanoarchaeia archaeon]
MRDCRPPLVSPETAIDKLADDLFRAAREAFVESQTKPTRSQFLLQARQHLNGSTALECVDRIQIYYDAELAKMGYNGGKQ